MKMRIRLDGIEERNIPLTNCRCGMVPILCPHYEKETELDVEVSEVMSVSCVVLLFGKQPPASLNQQKLVFWQ